MKITINGKEKDFDSVASLKELVEKLSQTPQRFEEI